MSSVAFLVNSLSLAKHEDHDLEAIHRAFHSIKPNEAPVFFCNYSPSRPRQLSLSDLVAISTEHKRKITLLLVHFLHLVGSNVRNSGSMILIGATSSVTVTKRPKRVRNHAKVKTIS